MFALIQDLLFKTELHGGIDELLNWTETNIKGSVMVC
jgi:hypothetical protein